MLEKDREYALSEIVSEYGFPVIVRKKRWSPDFVFQAETITGNTISGVAFKDGKEYLRTFGGGYTYKTNELFLFCGIPQKKVEPFNVGKNEDVIAAISEADEDNSRIKITDLTVSHGSILEKAFKKLNNTISVDSDLKPEERKHLNRIHEVVAKIISLIRNRIVVPEKPSWVDLETGPKGIAINPGLAEFYGLTMENMQHQNDIAEMTELDKNPYFTHALIQFDDEDTPEDIFIGEQLIYDYDSITPAVINWQSKLGNIAYDTQNTTFRINNATVYLQFRRKVEISDGQVIDVIEEYNRGKKTASKAEESMVYDSFLVKILREKRSHHEITNIIPSIQYNQNQIIRAPYNENFIVQGCAGCGKTMILLHRISYLLFNYRQYSQSRFLVLSPSKNFNEFIKPLTTDLKLQGINVSSVTEYYLNILLNIHKNWKDIEKDIRIFSDAEVDQRTIDTFYSEAYASELRKRVPKRIEALRKTNDEIIGLTKKKVQIKHERPDADVSEIDRQLKSLKNKRRISIFDDEFKDIIPEGLKPGNRKIPTCKAELFATVLVNYYCYGNSTGYAFVFIDEAQDLSKQELILIKNLNKSANFNVYGDLNQSIYESSISDWSELETIGSFGRYTLNENYRNTIEITEFINEEVFMNMSALGLNGQKPMLADQRTIYDIAHKAGKEDRIIAIIATDRSRDSISLPMYDIPVYKVSEIKGMEFDTVFVFPESMSENELYIAYSRAIDHLYVVNE